MKQQTKKTKCKSAFRKIPHKIEEQASALSISKEELTKRKKDAAKLYMTPDINAGSLITSIKNSQYAGSLMQQLRQENENNIRFEHILDEVIEANREVLDGNLREIESMLINQAKALDAVFYQYVGKTLSAEYINQKQVFAQIALKSQNQCRNTLATLADIKNPKQTLFVKQQNNANIQQVNSVEKIEVKNPEKSENFQKSANELLEVKNEQWLDTGAQSKTIAINTEMETVGKGRCKD